MCSYEVIRRMLVQSSGVEEEGAGGGGSKTMESRFPSRILSKMCLGQTQVGTRGAGRRGSTSPRQLAAHSQQAAYEREA